MGCALNAKNIMNQITKARNMGCVSKDMEKSVYISASMTPTKTFYNIYYFINILKTWPSAYINSYP